MEGACDSVFVYTEISKLALTGESAASRQSPAVENLVSGTTLLHDCTFKGSICRCRGSKFFHH